MGFLPFPAQQVQSQMAAISTQRILFIIQLFYWIEDVYKRQEDSMSRLEVIEQIIGLTWLQHRVDISMFPVHENLGRVDELSLIHICTIVPTTIDAS